MNRQMRIYNDTDEAVVLAPGEHVDIDAGAVRKNNRKIAILLINGVYGYNDEKCHQ